MRLSGHRVFITRGASGIGLELPAPSSLQEARRAASVPRSHGPIGLVT